MFDPSELSVPEGIVRRLDFTLYTDPVDVLQKAFRLWGRKRARAGRVVDFFPLGGLQGLLGPEVYGAVTKR